MELLRAELNGEHSRWMAGGDGSVPHPGVIGVEVAPLVLDGQPRTVVQLLLDDDEPGFDRSLLDSPLLAEVVTSDGAVVAREPFDHERFRRQLLAERDAGESVTRGVLVLTNGELPPPWIRLAFLQMDIAATAGANLVVRRSTVAELRRGVERAHSSGEVGDEERRALLIAIEQLHPEGGPGG